MAASAFSNVPAGGLAHEVRAMARVAMNQLTIESSYRNKFLIDAVAHILYLLPVVLTAWAFSDGRSSDHLSATTGLPNQFTFVILGMVAITALGVGNMLMQDTHVAGGISYEMVTGTLERLFITPVRRLTVILGISTYFMVLFMWQTVTLFVGAWLIFGFDPDPDAAGLAWAAFVIASLFVMNLSLGIIGAALTMAFKDQQMFLLVFMRPILIVSGAYFLIELAPHPFKAISLVNPVAYAIDAFRGSTNGGEPLLIDSMAAELAITGGSAVGLAVVAAFVYRRLMRHMESTGNLALF